MKNSSRKKKKKSVSKQCIYIHRVYYTYVAYPIRGSLSSMDEWVDSSCHLTRLVKPRTSIELVADSMDGVFFFFLKKRNFI